MGVTLQHYMGGHCDNSTFLLSLCHITIPRLIELSTGLREISQFLFRFLSAKAQVGTFNKERALFSRGQAYVDVEAVLLL